jgi:hypothetical protein
MLKKNQVPSRAALVRSAEMEAIRFLARSNTAELLKQQPSCHVSAGTVRLPERRHWVMRAWQRR